MPQNFSKFTILFQESAHEKSQKYKEGKFVLERLNLYIFTLAVAYWLRGVGCTFFCYGVHTNFAYPVCEYNRGRIVDEVDFSTEFYIDTRGCMSDGDEA